MTSPLSRSRVFLCIVPLLLVALCLSACGDVGDSATTRATTTPATGTAAAVLVKVAPVRIGTIERRWSAVGSLRADESVVVRPEIAGRIVSIGFQEGERVRGNDRLFALDDSIYAAELTQARANLALAERNANRARELFERQLIPAAERDATASALDVAQAAVKLAAAQADKTVIRAPFSGRMGLRQVAVGDYVSPGQDLVGIESLERMKLEFRLPELAMADVREGQPLEIALDAYPGQAFKGFLYAIDSRVADQTRSFAARARLDNADGRLRPGLFARVSLVVGRQDDALLIPEQAILVRGDRAYVFRVEDDKAVEQEVLIGQRREGDAQVLSGLSQDQSIIISGIQRVSNGTPVRTDEAPMSDDAASS